MCQVHLPIHTSQEEVVVVGGIELDLLLLKLWNQGLVSSHRVRAEKAMDGAYLRVCLRWEK